MAEMSFKFHFIDFELKPMPTHPGMTTSQNNCKFQSFRNPKLSEKVGGRAVSIASKCHIDLKKHEMQHFFAKKKRKWVGGQFP